MVSDNLILYFEKGGVGTIVLNRPEHLNALNISMLNKLRSTINSINYDSIRLVVFKGNGNRSFAAGADIKEMYEMTKKEALDYSILGNSVMDLIESIPVPTVAVVDGYALGGGFELALSCDFIICSENSKFGFPEVSLGIIPGFGGIKRLKKNICESFAKYIIFSANIFSSTDMKEFGLILKIVASENLENELTGLIESIIKNSNKALIAAKKLLTRKEESEQEIKEKELFASLFLEEDHSKRMKLFLEKKK